MNDALDQNTGTRPIQQLQRQIMERVNENLPQEAFSTDGRTFGYQARMSLRIPVGCYITLHALDNARYLGQIIRKEIVTQDGPEIGINLNPEQIDSLPDDLGLVRLLIGLFIFATCGGGALGFAYSWLAHSRMKHPDGQPESRAARLLRYGTNIFLIVVVLLVGYIALSVLQKRQANLMRVLRSKTVGTHWTAPVPVTITDSMPNPLAPPRLGQSVDPHVEDFIDRHNRLHQAWCDPDGQLQYQVEGLSIMPPSFPGCYGPLGLVVDRAGFAHLVWYSAEVERPSGARSRAHLLYESILRNSG